MNKRNPSGFTIVEIILFFAVSVALMLGIITGVGASISRQRYNDTVNDVAEYIRSVYTEVQSVSNNEFFTPGTAGRTEKAIYGKLLTFSANADGSTKITSQTIVGVAVSQSFTNFSLLDENPTTPCTSGADVLTQLGCVRGSADSGGNTSTYIPVWSGSLEKTNNNQTFTDCILVVRSPLNGAVHTYYSSDATCTSPHSYPASIAASTPDDYVTYFSTFQTTEVNICIDSEDNPNKRRRNLRITADAATSSGVILPALDSSHPDLGAGGSDKNGSKCKDYPSGAHRNVGNKPS